MRRNKPHKTQQARKLTAAPASAAASASSGTRTPRTRRPRLRAVSAPSASTLASLWRRVISADRGAVQWAQRMPATLLAAMEMPMPVVQMTMPFSHWPEATA